MWEGPRAGPRGGPPFRVDPRGEMFEGRDCPVPEFRGRDVKPMGHRPPDRPPMDMRRFDRPGDMRGREIEPLDIRGRETHRDFFRPGDEADSNIRRRFEIEMRSKLQGPPDFIGPGRPLLDMGGRDMNPRGLREPDNTFMGVRDRERYRLDMPGFGEPPMDSRRRLPMDEGFRDIHDRDRPRMGMEDIDGFSMDMPPREREMIDFDRRGSGAPLNSRGRFESDMDFRNRNRPSGEFRERERSPLTFGENDGIPIEVRGRPDLPPDFGGLNRPKFRGGEGNFRDVEFLEQRESAMSFRGREEKPHSDDWHGRDARDRGPFPPHMKGAPPFPKGRERFTPGRGREGDPGPGEPPDFPGRDRPPMEFPMEKEGSFGFPRPGREAMDSHGWDRNAPPDHFSGRDLPRFGQKGPQEHPLMNTPNRESEGKRWARDQDPKQNQVVPPRGRPPYLRGAEPNQGKSQPVPDRGGPESHPTFGEPKDLLAKPGQDGGKEQFPENSGNYRSASVKKEVSNTISITGIPKTATMEQILGAFAVRDGVPMQGMKIKNVVPGYSYDTAYVEFLNLEDAVHFMESNQVALPHRSATTVSTGRKTARAGGGGSLKVGTKTALMRYIQPDRNSKESPEMVHKDGQPQEPLLPTPGTAKKQPPESTGQDGHRQKPAADSLHQGVWQRSSNLTPEAWQQQMDQQQQQQQQQQLEAESWAARNPRHPPPMIIKNVKPTTTVETILKALDPYAYLDERNVRLQVARLVDLLTKPPPLMIDGVRVYVEIAKPLKNQNYRRDFDKSNTSLLGYPPDTSMMEQPYFSQPVQALLATPAIIQGDPVLPASRDATVSADPQINTNLTQGVPYAEVTAGEHTFQTPDSQATTVAPALATAGEGNDSYNYATETPDMSTYLYDATSGFYYDPQTTLYYDPSSRYFYNAQTQQYLYWDASTKTYIPVPGYTTDAQPPSAHATAPVAAPPEAQAPEGQQEAKNPAEAGSEKKEDEDAAPRTEKKEKEKEKEEKPRSLAAFKIMKDMERWAKIQNRQKESVRAPSPVLKTPSGPDDRKTSKAADAGFAIFERKGIAGDDLFKKPLAPPKKEEKTLKRPMGSLGLLAADYGAGSDEEEEEKHEAPRVVKTQSEEKEDKLTDWKKMACLLCRRQFPNKDALVRHQQLSDLHKQNMEIHLKIKRSKKELEALENQEKQLSSRDSRDSRDSSGSPEIKRKKYQNQNSWSNAPRETHKTAERPGLGSETMERKKKEPVVWNHATYKQAVRKAMFARFKELE
ncbi:hypothetical protein JZ751_014759 [Albula glossodonta]|uniref:C2H2-type domain-containing protein n=1 Tax=Albula glossodonta TaxID=121402 RepID=A0A8T2N2J0_9TELE|nr:hypothetical protein JZ751_014759 [Albula glossodonta]